MINLKGDDIMICPKCGSENTKIELVTTSQLKRKRNWFYWVCFIWVYDLLLWIFLFLPRLIIQLLKGKKYKITSKTEKYLVCNSCGYNQKIK